MRSSILHHISDNKINAGSMADIAFLLLIFFLVTTSIRDELGILVKLPPMDDSQIRVSDKNVMQIHINKFGQIMMEGEMVNLQEMKLKLNTFILNPDQKNDMPQSPRKAIIGLNTDRGTEYIKYIEVYDGIFEVYTDIRNSASREIYGQPFDLLKKVEKNEIKKSFPVLISESEPVQR